MPQVLTLRLDDRLRIGANVTVTIVEVCGQNVRLEIHAPVGMTVVPGRVVKTTSDLQAEGKN